MCVAAMSLCIWFLFFAPNKVFNIYHSHSTLFFVQTTNISIYLIYFVVPYKNQYNNVNFILKYIWYAGRLRGKRPRFTKIPWVTDNIKSLGVFHGYNINTDAVWKTIINQMKCCTQIWKTRNLTFKGNLLSYFFSQYLPIKFQHSKSLWIIL
jgi:hypothetical protein